MGAPIGRLAGAALIALTLAACSPEQLAWWTAKVDTAREQGWLCPLAAPLIELFGLPQHFDTVIFRESSCNPDAISRSGAIGLTQIMPFWLAELCPLDIACTPDDLRDPRRNLAAAAYVFAVQGPDAWSQTW